MIGSITLLVLTLFYYPASDFPTVHKAAGTGYPYFKKSQISAAESITHLILVFSAVFRKTIDKLKLLYYNTVQV